MNWISYVHFYKTHVCFDWVTGKYVSGPWTGGGGWLDRHESQPSSSTSFSFNSHLQISWSLLYLPQPQRLTHQFSTTFHVSFLCAFAAKSSIQGENRCDGDKRTAAVGARWPPAAISLCLCCVSFSEYSITRTFKHFMDYSHFVLQCLTGFWCYRVIFATVNYLCFFYIWFINRLISQSTCRSQRVWFYLTSFYTHCLQSTASLPVSSPFVIFRTEVCESRSHPHPLQLNVNKTPLWTTWSDMCTCSTPSCKK